MSQNPITIHQQPVSIQHNIYNINPNHRPINQYKSQDHRFIPQVSPRNPVNFQQTVQPSHHASYNQIDLNAYKRRENVENSNYYVSSKGDGNRLSPIPKNFSYGSR